MSQRRLRTMRRVVQKQMEEVIEVNARMIKPKWPWVPEWIWMWALGKFVFIRHNNKHKVKERLREGRARML